MQADNPAGFLGDVEGDPWERLFPQGWSPEKPDVPPPAGRPPSRTLCDIKRLPAHNMVLFGRNPETDDFTTVVCAICGTLVIPQALRDHLKKHGEATEALQSQLYLVKNSSESSDVTDAPNIICTTCNASLPAASYRRHVLKVHGEGSTTVSKVKTAPWDRLFPQGWSTDAPDVLPPTGRPPSRTLCDIKRLPAQNMALFGRAPDTDPFSTVVCTICGILVIPQALRDHLNKHEEATDTLQSLKSNVYLPRNVEEEADEGNIVCGICNASVPFSSFRKHVVKVHGDDPLKTKTATKPTVLKKLTPTKSASASPPDLTDELSKEVRKPIKSRKSRSPTLPELELMMPTGKRAGLPGGPPELLPAELPKKVSSSKKKVEKKPDKVYDPNKNCGVINEAGKPCLRSILCKVHLVAHKRAVLNRSLPYDALTKLLKAQGEEERRPKLEVIETAAVTVVAAVPELAPPMVVPLAPVTLIESSYTPEVWSDPQEEPLAKRLKTEELEDDQFPEIPSDLEALIEATLNEELASLPVVPRSEPLLRWSLEIPMSPPTPLPPPMVSADLPWHPTHPRPLATNTFGCRLVGGLMTKSKKLDAFRKHVQSVWASPSKGSPDSPSKLPGFGMRSMLSPTKKTAAPAPRRKRRNSGSSSSPSAASELITGILQRAANTSPQNGVNGVPLRLLPSNLPGSQQAFIQLNLCPSK